MPQAPIIDLCLALLRKGLRRGTRGRHHGAPCRQRSRVAVDIYLDRLLLLLPTGFVYRNSPRSYTPRNPCLSMNMARVSQAS